MTESSHVATATPPQCGDKEGREYPQKHLLAIESIESGLIVAGPCVPWLWENEPLGRPTWDEIADVERRREEPGPVITSAFLEWTSNACTHGLKRHHVEADGSIREIGDRSCQAAPQKKPKGVSARQWGRC